MGIGWRRDEAGGWKIRSRPVRVSACGSHRARGGRGEHFKVPRPVSLTPQCEGEEGEGGEEWAV